jgi:hypothetical protein
MAEKSLAAYVRDGLSKVGIRTRRIESLGPGIADVYFQSAVSRKVSGWIELKCVYGWPVRPATKVRLRWLTPEQVLFAEQYHAWLMVRVDSAREYFLFAWCDVRELHDGLTQEDWRRCAVGYWKRSINWSEMSEKLSEQG